MSNNRRNQALPKVAGFTLVEVVISITLFAIALTLLVGAFGFTSRAWESGERTAAETADLVAVHRILNNMLDRLFPATLQSKEDEVYAFSGTADRLRFTAQLPPYPTAGGLHIVEFSITHSEDLSRLRLKIVPHSAEAFTDSELDTDDKSLLLTTPAKLSFSYYDSNIAEDWLSEWSTSEPPPQLVKLEIVESEKPLAEIVAPITVNMDLSCAVPEIEGACRQ